MDLKMKALALHNEGKSYQEIGKALGIGKTTAYDYVKELKPKKKDERIITVPNGSELSPNARSEQVAERNDKAFIFDITNQTNSNKIAVTNIPNDKRLQGFTGKQLLEMKFDTLNFTGRFLDLIGKPEKCFAGLIWGLPKGGKSNLALRFADYLQEYFGNVLYVAAEEGKSVSMQDKIKDIGGSDMMFIETRNRDDIKDFIAKNKFDFVFIDSINVADIDNDFLESLKQANSKTSFVVIVQATKGGNFKGEQSLEHNCDFVIKVVNGLAYHKGRFGPESEIEIFKEPLYLKNVSKKLELTVLPTKIKPLKTDFSDFKIETHKNFNYPIITNTQVSTSTNNLNQSQFQNNNAGTDFVVKALLVGTGVLIINEIFKEKKS